MKKRILLALLLVGIVGGIPFLFRPEESASFLPGFGERDTLIIISPHSEPMKYEFERGFRKHYKEKYGKDVYIDYRAPGGTSDIVRYIADRFTAEFRLYWEKDKNNPPWSNEIASYFASPGAEKNPRLSKEVRLAREKFLSSDVGIGIDLFFGGGTFEHARNAKRGYSVDGGIAKRHPEYLHKDLVPVSFGGDNIYDPKGLYYGVSLSSFGICYNKKRLAEMGKEGIPPEKWRDLAHPRFFRKIAAADPTKSGSANKSYELIIQQAMHDSLPKGIRKPSADQLDAAWSAGIGLVRCLMANARVITGSAGSVTHCVSVGDAVAGTAIDFYGLAQREWNSWQLGKGKEPEITYVPPKGGTTISADPVQLLRGAPNRKVAEAFLDYVIGPEGQKLLCYKRGIESGPEKYILRHAPVRRDLYGKEYHKFLTDPDYAPYEAAKLSFTYRGDWTGRYFSLIRILIKCIMLDVQEELVEAWKAIILAGGPEKVPMAMKEFNALPFSFREASKAASLLKPGKGRTALDAAKVCRNWSDFARDQYKKAAKLAKEGK